MLDKKIILFGATMHDIGKLSTPMDIRPHHYGHEEAGLEIIDKICDRLRVPNDYRKFAKLSCKYHMVLRRLYEMKPGHIYDIIKDITNGFKNIETMDALFQVSKADLYGRGKEPREERINQFNKSEEIAYNMYNILENVSASDFQELIEKSDKLSGKEFGEMLRVKKIQYYINQINNRKDVMENCNKIKLTDYCNQFERVADHLSDEVANNSYSKEKAIEIVEKCADELRNKVEKHIEENIQKIQDTEESS